jgi:glycosyltransferase involved in cell wall biosynthesis
MLAIDCSKIESRPTGPGRWLLNILRYWPDDFPARLYFRRQIPEYDFLNKKSLGSRISPPLASLAFGGALGFFSKVDPLWRHLILPRALKRDKVSTLLEPFYIPLLTWPPEKTILCIADISYKRHPEWFGRRSQLRWFPDRLVKRVRHVITISEFSKREIMDYYGIPESRITVTPLAADPIFKSPARDFQPPLSKHYFLFWGDLNNRRHPKEMIEAFVRTQIADRQAQSLSFIVVGRDITNPPQRILRRIEEANRTLGREAIIHKEYPSDAELVWLVQGALAVVYLSDYEGFGMPVLEGMACGAPVITSYTSSLPEVGGNAAYYIKDNTNTEEIAAAMKYLAEQPEARKKLSAEGIRQASHFSWKITADRTIEVLKNIHNH